MTTAPGLIQLAVTDSGRPIATIRMSACCAIEAGSVVPVWQTVPPWRHPPGLFDEQQGHRLADDLRTPEHDRMSPASRHSPEPRELADPQRGARDEARNSL